MQKYPDVINSYACILLVFVIMYLNYMPVLLIELDACKYLLSYVYCL